MNAVPQGVTERRLPFTFAKRHGVVIDYDHADGPRLLYRPDVNLNALQEAQRLMQGVFPHMQVNEQEFSDYLNRASTPILTMRCRWWKGLVTPWISALWPTLCRRLKI